MCSSATDFKDRVEAGLRTTKRGTKMFEPVGKMNNLKSTLKQLNKEKFTEVEKRADQAMEFLFIKWIEECLTTTQYSIALNGGLYGKIQGKIGLSEGDPISPLLFVICMKYFTRILNQVAQMTGFEYHTKCKGIKLNHLCFADNMLHFCKGTYQSVLLLLRGLQTFTNASGLSTNAGKSNIFSTNMEGQHLADLCKVTGYKKGTLPFRYLRVPITARKLSALDCEMLVDKMVTRVTTRSLVMKKIIAICRNFLWDGKVTTDKTPLIALELSADWWQYKPPIDCSWYWKRICSIKERFKDGYIGNGWLAQNGRYSIQSGYKWRRGEQDNWQWERMLEANIAMAFENSKYNTPRTIEKNDKED
ncbi:uncharacterized protein LOC132624101 [Lycium barbarum]|uniref:uncharacterized protein LOC132624101 n=1 Tax=Lycium barbarum TaxID=112863 RepID=UPI00293E5DF0|nr:uncharacterized protein LOC132624101 [Lycium barbarum]